MLTELIRAFATQLQKLNKKNVDDWSSDSTTPEQPGAKLCFDRNQIAITPPCHNAEIKDEAGRRVICTGYAADFHSPVTIQNLSDPNAIHVYGEYQVGPTNGHYVGCMCISITAAGTTAVAGTTAMFVCLSSPKPA